MLSKLVLITSVTAILSCFTANTLAATNSVKIGISVEIKSSERCDYSYTLNNTISNQLNSNNCETTAENFQQFHNSIVKMTTTSLTDNSNNTVRIVKTAQ